MQIVVKALIGSDRRGVQYEMITQTFGMDEVWNFRAYATQLINNDRLHSLSMRLMDEGEIEQHTKGE